MCNHQWGLLVYYFTCSTNHIYARIYIHAYMHAVIQAYMDSYVFAYIIHTNVHSSIYIHTCIRTYIYTFSHRNLEILNFPKSKNQNKKELAQILEIESIQWLTEWVFVRHSKDAPSRIVLVNGSSHLRSCLHSSANPSTDHRYSADEKPSR